MRDPARIDRILELVREVWIRYPDYRLGQLLVNAIRPSQPCSQVFYPEDDTVEKGLREFFGTGRTRYTENEVTLGLTKHEAIVLLALVLGFRESGELRFETTAERQILWDVCALLEQQLGRELRDPTWPHLLDEARNRVVSDG